MPSRNTNAARSAPRVARPPVGRRRAGAVLGLLLLLPPAAVSARSAREEATREFSRTLPMRAGQAFRLEHQQGDVTIATHALAEARIVAHIRVSAPTAGEAQAALPQVAIDVQETPAAVAVRTRYPDTRARNISYAVDYEITLPETAPLWARNSFGVHAICVVRRDYTSGERLLKDKSNVLEGAALPLGIAHDGQRRLVRCA